MTQAERLAKREALRGEIAKIEVGLRELLEEERRLLSGCEHTYANGQSAVVGGRTKVCVPCGRTLVARDEKLWG